MRDTFVIALCCGALVLGVIVGVMIAERGPCPSTVEERCGIIAEETCPPGTRTDYTSTQEERCRRELFESCLSERSATMETCREECGEIVKDLSNKNDELWERWLACTEDERGVTR